MSESDFTPKSLSAFLEDTMVAPQTCPTPAVLHEFWEGRLSDHDSDSLGAHLAHCASCGRRFDQLEASSAPRGAVADASRQSASRPAPPSSAAPDPVIEKVLAACRAARPELAMGIAKGRPGDETRLQLALRALTPKLAPADRPAAYGALDCYVLLRVLGQGGMGVVFEAEDQKLRRRVAVKVLHPLLASEAAHRERFLREARAAAKLSGHEQVVEIHRVDEWQGTPYLVMPLLRGRSLESRLLAAAGPLPAGEALHVARQIALGLAAAHVVGLVHRDVKPSNVWLDDEGRVKLLDFGLVQDESTGELTQSGMLLGTVDYMSPEQCEQTTVDFRSDLFSLGCTLYRMLTGRLPFGGETATAKMLARLQSAAPAAGVVNPQVGPDLSRLVEQLMARSPADRPATAAEVAADLATLAARPSPLAGASATTKESRQPALRQEKPASNDAPPRWSRRRVWRVAASCATVAACLGGLLFSTVAQERTSRLAPAESPPSKSADGRLPILTATALVAEPATLPQNAADVASWSWETTAHRGGVALTSVSPSGETLATCDQEGTLRLWGTADGNLRLVLPGPARLAVPLKAGSLAWSPDASVIAAAYADGAVRMWDTENGRPLRSPPIATDDAGVLAWSPDGRRLAAARLDGVRIWDVATGRQSASFTPEDGRWHCSGIGWSPDGKSIATFVESLQDATRREVQIWNVAERRLRQRAATRYNVPHQVRWSADSRYVAMGTSGAQFEVFDATRGERVWERPGAGDVVFLPNQLALGGSIYAWPPTAENPPPLREIPGSIISWSPRGDFYVTGDAVPRLVRAEGNQEVARLAPTNGGIATNRISWSADGGRVYSLGSVWDLTRGTLVRGFSEAGLGEPALSPSGRLLARGRDFVVTVTDLETGSDQPVGWSVTAALAWSPRDEFLVGYHQGRLVRYEVATRASEDMTDGRLKNEPRAMAWSPAGTTLAVITADGRLALWDGITRARLAAPPFQETVHGLRWSRDGQRLVLIADQGNGLAKTPLYVVEPNGKLVTTWQVESRGMLIGSFGFSADGARLLAGTMDRRWQAWELAAGRVVDSGTIAGLFQGDLSPNGRTVLGGAAWLSDVSTGRSLGRLTPLADRQGVILRPDGSYHEAAGTDEGLVAVVRQANGQTFYSPAAFSQKFGWRNASAEAPK